MITNRLEICWKCQRIAEMWALVDIVESDGSIHSHLHCCYSHRFRYKAKHRYRKIVHRTYPLNYGFIYA